MATTQLPRDKNGMLLAPTSFMAPYERKDVEAVIHRLQVLGYDEEADTIIAMHNFHASEETRLRGFIDDMLEASNHMIQARNPSNIWFGIAIAACVFNIIVTFTK